MVDKGYEFLANKQLLTVFSAPNYCGEFHNDGAAIEVDEALTMTFKVGNTNYFGCFRRTHKSLLLLTMKQKRELR